MRVILILNLLGTYTNTQMIRWNKKLFIRTNQNVHKVLFGEEEKTNLQIGRKLTTDSCERLNSLQSRI